MQMRVGLSNRLFYYHGLTYIADYTCTFTYMAHIILLYYMRTGKPEMSGMKRNETQYARLISLTVCRVHEIFLCRTSSKISF